VWLSLLICLAFLELSLGTQQVDDPAIKRPHSPQEDEVSPLKRVREGGLGNGEPVSPMQTQQLTRVSPISSMPHRVALVVCKSYHPTGDTPRIQLPQELSSPGV